MKRSGVSGTAVISACERYRTELTRDLDPSNRRPLLVCGLNPSTATAEADDATIRKVSKFAARWGCGRLVMVNAYDYRTSDPDEMFRVARQGVTIATPQNEATLRRLVEATRAADGITLVAWGRRIQPGRQSELVSLFGNGTSCLGHNKDGSPVHPLYQRDDAAPVRWGL
jgi:hypothetical protein